MGGPGALEISRVWWPRVRLALCHHRTMSLVPAPRGHWTLSTIWELLRSQAGPGDRRQSPQGGGVTQGHSQGGGMTRIQP